jgi:hypothetical protein
MRRRNSKRRGRSNFSACTDFRLCALLVCPGGCSGWSLLRSQPDNPAIWGSKRRSAGSNAVAVLLIGARGGLRHHSATAKEYCPSSSAVARQYLALLVRNSVRIPIFASGPSSLGGARHTLLGNPPRGLSLNRRAMWRWRGSRRLIAAIDDQMKPAPISGQAISIGDRRRVQGVGRAW